MLHGISLVASTWGYSVVAVCRLLAVMASLVAEHELQTCRLQELWFPGSRAQLQQLWHMNLGLVPLWHVESSQVREELVMSSPT